MTPLLLEFLNAREVDPATLVTLAARNDIHLVALCIRPFKALTGQELPFSALPDWDVVADTPNRRELKRRLELEGVGVDSADVFPLGPDTAVQDFRPELEAAAWLGAARVTIIPGDPDRVRLDDTAAAFCDLAAEYGLKVLHENSLRMTNQTIVEQREFQRRLGKPNLEMVIDFLHNYRAGSTIEQIADLDASEVGRIQLCDGPAQTPERGGGYEAFYERMIPGEGDFPMVEMIRATPEGVNIGFEVPLWELQQAGVGPAERVRRIVTAGRKLLADSGR